MIRPHYCRRGEPASLTERWVGTLTQPAGRSVRIPPAAFIEYLDIFIRFDSAQLRRVGESWLLVNDSECGCPISVVVEDVEYSFATLFPQMKCLTQLTLDGQLIQKHLDMIAQLSSLRVLKLREEGRVLWKGWREYGSLPDEYAKSWCLKWDFLALLTNLQQLEVRCVHLRESQSLFETITKLGKLEKLLACAAVAYPIDDQYEYLSDTMATFLRHLSTPGYTLPSSLGSLAFADGDPVPSFLSQAIREPKRSFLHSRDLYLDVVELDWIDVLMKAPLISNLRRLAIPIAVIAPYKLIPTIELYHPMLNQIALLDVWQGDPAHCRDLESLFLNLFLVEDLVLGTKCENCYNQGGREVEASVSRDLYGYTDLVESSKPARTPNVKPRWSRQLRRIRVDQTEIFPTFDFLLPEDYAELRILVLRPWKVHHSQFEDNEDSKGSNDLMYCAETLLDAEKQAESLASQVHGRRLPELQVLVLGGYWFWIAKDTSDVGSEATSRKLWRFHDAEVDALQSKEIRKCLSARDWSFLQDVPPAPCDEDEGARILFEQCPAPSMIRRRSYMVLYRRNRSESKGGESTERVYRHESSLTDLAVWGFYCE